jgi:hypothetical protein
MILVIIAKPGRAVTVFSFSPVRHCEAQKTMAIFLFQQHRLLRQDFVLPRNDDIDVLLSLHTAKGSEGCEAT